MQHQTPISVRTLPFMLALASTSALACFLQACTSADGHQSASRESAPQIAQETSSSNAPVPPPADLRLATSLQEQDVILNVAPWVDQGIPGQAITTRNFVIYTSDNSDFIAGRLPMFLESWLASVQQSFPFLPAPSRKLEVYVLDTREQWQAMTIRLLGPAGRSIAQIRRGGFSTGGKSLLFDIGPQDTLAIAAHETWHAYTQSTFVDQLPIAFEEAFATFAEGHKWKHNNVTFEPWFNSNRHTRLKETLAQGNLLSLVDVLTQTPNAMIHSGQINDQPVVWYAQAWALGHFLREGANAKYRDRLTALLADAAAGRLSAKLPQGAARTGVGPSAQTLTIFRTYFNTDLSEANAEYQAFIQQIAR